MRPEMSGVLMQPHFRVSEYVPVEGPRMVAIELDEHEIAVMLTKAQARRLSKSLLREAHRWIEE